MQAYIDIMEWVDLTSPDSEFAIDGYVFNSKRGAAYLFNERAAVAFLYVYQKK